MKNQRLHDLDALRGIMMLLGIVLHGAASFVVYPIDELWPYKFFETHQLFDALLTIIHLFRIPVFFIIAGFFLSKQLSKYGIHGGLRRRFWRIVIPFVFGMFFLAPWVSYGFGVLAHGQEWNGFAEVIKYVFISKSGTVHFWFLYYLIFFNFIHLLYQKYLDFWFSEKHISNTIVYLAFSAFQLSVLFVFGNDSIHGDYSFMPAIGSLLYFFGYYFFGVWVSGHYTGFIRLSNFSFKKLILVVGLMTTYLVFRDNEKYFEQYSIWPYTESILTILTSFSLILVTFGLFRLVFSQERRWAKIIASASYTVYMVHLPILVWLLYVLKNAVSNPFVLFGMLVVLTSGIAWLVYLFLGKLKVEKE